MRAAAADYLSGERVTMHYELTPEEFDELKQLSKDAQTTPVILMGGVNLAAAARKRVDDKWAEIARRCNVRVDTIGPSEKGAQWFKGEPMERGT